MAQMIAAQLSVRKDTLDLVTQSLAGVKNGVRKALAGAINDTLAKAKTASAKGIAASVNLKSAEIKKGLRVVKASWDVLSGLLVVSGKRLRLVAFGARQNRKGVTYLISKQEGRKLLPHAFITDVVGARSREEIGFSNRGRIKAQVLSGDAISTHTGVYVRRGKARLPISERYGVSVVGAFEGAPDLVAQVLKDSEADLDKRVRSKVEYLLDRQAQSRMDKVGTFAA